MRQVLHFTGTARLVVRSGAVWVAGWVNRLLDIKESHSHARAASATCTTIITGAHVSVQAHHYARGGSDQHLR